MTSLNKIFVKKPTKLNVTQSFANNFNFIKMFPYTKNFSKSRTQFNDPNEFRKSLFDVCVCSCFG